MEPIKFDPRYSTSKVPGRCIKCLAEQELNNCLLKLLRAEGDDEELARRFEILVTFLKSPEAQRLRADSERYLSEGKEVNVRIDFVDGEPKYILEVKE